MRSIRQVPDQQGDSVLPVPKKFKSRDFPCQVKSLKLNSLIFQKSINILYEEFGIEPLVTPITRIGIKNYVKFSKGYL
jgi:hypothetical protein